MAKVYVEARPKGRPEGSPITDYVVEDHADHVLHTSSTQHAAIDWAKKNGHEPHVARVRHLNDKKKPDHWRKVRTVEAGCCRPLFNTGVLVCNKRETADEQCGYYHYD